MTGKATHAVRRISCLFQRAVHSDTEHATCDARHETDAGAASSIPLSRPDMRQTIQDPPNLPYPTRRCEERECAPRSSTCTTLVVAETAGPVAGVTSGVVRGSAQPSRRSSAMFCTMLTGWALATGFAAQTGNHALGEQPRRAEAIDTHGDGRSPCVTLLADSAARSCISRCVIPVRCLGGLERPCLCRWLETGYAGPHWRS